jgi:thioredoxin reductase (NADPH)
MAGRAMTDSGERPLDCVIVGAGPAGLTGALYLARFHRRFVLIDAGDPRAGWIPTSHNVPMFAEGIGGKELLARQRETAARYGAEVVNGTATRIERSGKSFVVHAETEAGSRVYTARHVMLATGADDIEPDLPDIEGAVRRGLVRYCPICDGYEVTGKKVAVIGYGDRGLGEASFIARTYDCDVTLLTLGQEMKLDAAEREKIARHGLTVVEEPVRSLRVDGDRIEALCFAGGAEREFDTLYSALGLKVRSDLAVALGAEADEDGALCVDDHCETSVPGLYAVGDVVRALNQIVVGMGHAAIAATDIHNKCEPRTQEEPEGRKRG